MRLIKNFLTKNDCYKASQKITPKGGMLHSTGANNPTLKRYVQPDIEGIGKNKYSNDWNCAKPDGQSKCCHGFIGKLDNGNIATIQTLPWDINGWHCGGTGNQKYIGIEICEDGLTDATYFKKVYQEAVEVFAYLAQKYNWNPLTDIIDHREGALKGIASNHGDVKHWFSKHGKTMDEFRADVKKQMDSSTTTSNATATKKLYRVQVGAFSVKANADRFLKELTGKGYNAFIVKAGVLYRVQVGAFSVKSNADRLAAELKSKGYSPFVKLS